jgi:hypothetical protein
LHDLQGIGGDGECGGEIGGKLGGGDIGFVSKDNRITGTMTSVLNIKIMQRYTEARVYFIVRVSVAVSTGVSTGVLGFGGTTIGVGRV